MFNNQKKKKKKKEKKRGGGGGVCTKAHVARMGHSNNLIKITEKQSLFIHARKFLYVAMVLGTVTHNERSNNRDNVGDIAGSKQQKLAL